MSNEDLRTAFLRLFEKNFRDVGRIITHYEAFNYVKEAKWLQECLRELVNPDTPSSRFRIFLRQLRDVKMHQDRVQIKLKKQGDLVTKILENKQDLHKHYQNSFSRLDQLKSFGNNATRSSTAAERP